MIVGRSTDYTGPGKVKTRSENWFIAAGAGRDAAMLGFRITREAKDRHGAYHWRVTIERGEVTK